jgi:hypothetical protein
MGKLADSSLLSPVIWVESVFVICRKSSAAGFKEIFGIDQIDCFPLYTDAGNPSIFPPTPAHTRHSRSVVFGKANIPSVLSVAH